MQRITPEIATQPVLAEAPRADDVASAAGRTFRRQAPLNAAVNVPVALVTGAILWSSAPHRGIVIWVAAHLLIAMLLVLRWWQVRRREPLVFGAGDGIDAARPGTATRSTGSRLRGWMRHFGVASSIVSGLAWGSTALFLSYVPPIQQMMLIIVVSSMAAGATTTLASIPAAANAFVLTSILPFALYFALQDEVEYAGLAIMALVMTGAMIFATRLVHRMVRAELTARLENQRSLQQLAAARAEWLDISQTTEAFALFDANDALQLWNENFGRTLSLPAGMLQRGVAHRVLLAAAARPVLIEVADQGLRPVANGREQFGGQQDGGETLVARAWLDALLSKADSNAGQVTARLDNGRWLRSQARRTSSGSLVIVHVDITAVKNAEEALLEREAELRQASKLEAVGKLAGGIAHDFNNILTVIIGYAQMLELLSANSEPALEAAQQINRAAERAASLTRQLLAFSRKQALQPKIVDLNEVIRDMDKLLRRLVPRTITLDVTLGAQIGPVRVDPHQMEQVVVNLVINGCDAMPSGGRLHIETSEVDAERGREVVLRISDTGVGMDAATQERAFEPFFTTKQPGQGTGLGLASVYGFVRQSEGDIRVASAPGKGSEFAIHLPRAEAQPDIAPAPDTADSLAPDQVTIMVVEDEAVVRTLVVETLLRHGYNVLEADGGAMALRISRLHNGQVDLLLTDVVMPDMSGWALAAQLRDERPATRQLFMSGFVGDATRAQERDGVILLAKPFTTETLLRQVRDALAR